jgi:hypothetical protein
MKKLFLLASIALSINAFAQVPTNGLIAWYPFNGNAIDESGNGNNGTVNGATLTMDRFGNTNSAYNFDGITNYIDLGQQNQLLATQPFTISAWANIPTSSTNTSNSFLYRGDWAEMNQFGFNFAGIPAKTTYIMRVAGSQQTCSGNTTINDGIWHLVTWTHDGSGLIKIYVDNQLETSATITNQTNLSFNLILGRLGDTSSHTYTGLADDIGIWNRALTQQEITDLYNGSGPQVVISPTCNSSLNNIIFEAADGWPLVPDINIPANAVQGPLEIINDGTPGLVILGTPPLINVPMSALGCDTLGNLAQNLTGKIAIIYRGNCEFSLKAYNAQKRGAVGVIIISHTGGPIPMGVGTFGGSVTIPVVMIGREQGDSLVSCLNTGGATTGFIGVVTTLAQDPFCPTDTFSTMASMAISSGDAALIADKIYTIEAWNTPKTLTEYNITTGISSVINNPAFQLGETSIVGLGGNLFVFGGYNGSASNMATKYNISNNTWTTLTNLPNSMTQTSAVALNNFIYITGGSLGVTQQYFFKYDSITNTYTTLAPPTIQRSNGKLVVYNNKIYCLGGHGTFGVTNDFSVYDELLNTWSSLSPMPFSLTKVATTVKGDYLYVFGGAILPLLTPHYEYFAYDFLNNTWSVANDLIPVAMMNGIASYNDTIYIPNGTLSQKYYCGSGVVTGINNAITPNAIIAYPNPTTGMLTINGTEIETINVYDISGRMVLQQTYNKTNHVVLDVKNLSKGLYQVIVNNKTPIKIVKE